MPLPDRSPADLADVELIDPDNDAPPSAEPRPELQERRSIVSSLAVSSPAVAAAALAAIVVALVIMSRSGPDVPPAPPGPATAATSVSGADYPTVDPAPDQPIPAFDDQLPSELPGVLAGFDSRGSLVLIDRVEPGPTEVKAGLVPITAEPAVQLGIGAGKPIGFDELLVFSGSTVAVRGDDGQPIGPPIDLRRLGADDVVMVVSRLATSQAAIMVSLGGLGIIEDAEWQWAIPGLDAKVLGVWEGDLVVSQAGRTWLMPLPVADPGASPRLVADGRVLSYDGRRLARLVCAEPGRCNIMVGSPAEPDQRQVPVPEPLSALELGAWTESVALSPDGRWLAVMIDQGPRLMVVDFDTGEGQVEGTTALPGAPLAWSPDSQWLAYASYPRVVVRNITAARSWAITVNRDLQTLSWTERLEP